VTPRLSDELRQALAKQPPGEPLKVEDDVTQTQYVIVPINVFEQMQRAIAYADSQPDPREYYPAFARAVQADVDAPGMSDYDDYDAHRARS
jgi:hypothetical protein